MIKNIFNQLKFYLLQHTELENHLPQSYVEALKGYDIHNLETIKPIIMALFSEARINEEASLEFIDKERYTELPDFCPLCHHLINDNNIFQMLNICYQNFPLEFENYIVAIVEHPFLDNIIADAYQEVFSGEDGLQRWEAFIDAERPQKLSNCLTLVFQEFCSLLSNNDSAEMIDDRLTIETKALFSHYFERKEQLLFLSALTNLHSIGFFTAENKILFSNFIQKVDILAYQDLNEFFTFSELNTSNQLRIRAFQIILNHPQHLREVINTLVHFVMFDIFSANLLDTIEFHPHLDTISEIFNALTTTGIMTAENCEQLYYQFLPMVHQIAQSGALNIFILGIANEQDFMEEDWQEMLNLINNQATEEELQDFIEDIFNLHHDAEIIVLDDEETGELIFNDKQSTHNHSVHKSASKSAISLGKQYSIENPSSILNAIKNYFDSIRESGWENMAAFRAFHNISTEKYYYTDPKSNKTLRELIMLTWMALHDDMLRLGEREDALKLWLRGLYEIQRGKNDIDAPSLPDNPICPSGGFNKLALCMSGSHSLIELKFISNTSFIFKFHASIQTLMHNYIRQLSNPINLRDFLRFNEMIKKLELDGVGEYWPLMRDYLIIYLYEEFKSLFKKINDPYFLEIIDSGEYAEVHKLHQHQKMVSKSRGYQQYCFSSLFSWPKHSYNQHEFDKQHGLIVYSPAQ